MADAKSSSSSDPKVFISYRRSDSAGHARALHRELCRRFDADFAFFDRSGVEGGDNFRERLKTTVERCVVALVVIGPGWMEAQAADGARRLDDPNDLVRLEVSLALAKGKVVIPVLMDDAVWPPDGSLPDDLKELADRDSFRLGGKDYEYERDLEGLVKQLAGRTGVAPLRQNTGFAIDVGDEVALYSHIEYLPVRLRAPLREVFRPLIEDRQRFFGGRRDEVDRLMTFIGRSEPGYCVVSSPAGFGKTALAANLVAGSGDSIAYHFFTPLYGEDTLSESFFLRSVLEQMSAWHGELWDLPPTLDDMRAVYQQVIGQPLAGTGVLVLDGIDEARGWSLAPYLARSLPVGIKVIATVRDVGQDWRAEYRFPTAQLTSIALNGLDRNGVGAVLSTIQGSGADLAREETVCEVIYELAGGGDKGARYADPFYIRFLAEDIETGLLTADTLTTAPKGLEAYLDQWWSDIRALAGDQPVRDLFGTLAVAAGPMQREELESLLPTLVDEWHADRFEEVLAGVRRFVVRDASGGYSLIHPRLRDFIKGRIKVEPYLAGLLAYCRDWRSGSRYALGYVGLHLAEAGAWGELRSLVATQISGRPFLEARYAADSSPAGFLRDLERFAQHAEELALTVPSELGDVIRCALVASSVRTMSGKLAPSLIAAAVQHGIWTISAAIEQTNEIPDPEQRSKALAALLPWMTEEQIWRACEMAVGAAKAMRPDTRPPGVLVIMGPLPPIRDVDRRGDVLAPLAEMFPDALREDALSIVRALDRSEQIPVLLTQLGVNSTPPERAALFTEALAAVEKVRSRLRGRLTFFMVPITVRKARALAAMSVYLEEPNRTDVCRMALDHALKAHGVRAISAVIELLPKMPAAVADEASERILASLDKLGSRRLKDLAAVARYLSAGAKRDAIIAEIRSRVQDEEDPEAAVEGLLALLPFGAESERPGLLEMVFERAALIVYEYVPGMLFTRIAEQTDGPWRQRAVDLAIKVCGTGENVEKVEVLSRLAPMMDNDSSREVLQLITTSPDEGGRLRLLDNMAPFLGREAIVEALAFDRLIGDGVRAEDLVELNDVVWSKDTEVTDDEDYDYYQDLYAVERPDTLDHARRIAFDLERVAGLVVVAPSLPEAERPGVLDEAFSEAVRINDRARRQKALCIVARALVETSRVPLAELCINAVRRGSSRPRLELASDLAALKPLIGQVDDSVAASIGPIVDEVAQWFP